MFAKRISEDEHIAEEITSDTFFSNALIRILDNSHPKRRISHPYITNLLQRYDIIKEWICIPKNH